MKKWISLIALGYLPGCAFFTEPMYATPYQEQIACEQSTWCHTFIDDRPAWVFKYNSGYSDCVKHASEIVKQASLDGRDAWFVLGTFKGDRHIVAVVDGWAIDNGALSDLRRFPSKELSNLMQVQGTLDDLPSEWLE